MRPRLKRALSPREAQEESAVIDVGSNSVRLVVYRRQGRALTPLLNEKVMAGLGRHLGQTGKLNPKGVEMALTALARFSAMLAAMGVKTVVTAATAAVREAEDGPAFAARALAETGLKLKIVSGAEEARLSALGVLAAIPDAMGVVGDLGGSSLELIEVTPQGPGPGKTFALGPLALMDGPFDADRLAARVDDILARGGFRASEKGATFYAVGGAWRAIGRVHMEDHKHPIAVLHQHEMPRLEVLETAAKIRSMTKRQLDKLPEAAAKRADSLPYAAIVLERVLRAGGFEKVALSSYGLREGLLVDKLSPALLRVDPLVASAEAFGAHTLRARAFGAALGQWLTPLREAAPTAFGAARDATLWAAAARLADVGALLHPDQRESLMFELILESPIVGVRHAERAFLAGALARRYGRVATGRAAFDRLLNDDQKRAALLLGAGMRLAADLSGRAAGLLAAFKLSVQPGVLVLSAQARFRHLLTDQAQKRLEPAAAALGLVARVSG